MAVFWVAGPRSPTAIRNWNLTYVKVGFGMCRLHLISFTIIGLFYYFSRVWWSAEDRINPSKLKLVETIFKNSVRTAKET
jgi:hypothetical protein